MLVKATVITIPHLCHQQDSRDKLQGSDSSGLVFEVEINKSSVVNSLYVSTVMYQHLHYAAPLLTRALWLIYHCRLVRAASSSEGLLGASHSRLQQWEPSNRAKGRRASVPLLCGSTHTFTQIHLQLLPQRRKETDFSSACNAK